MSASKEFSSFTASIDRKTRNVDVAREVAEDALQLTRSLPSSELARWVDEYAVTLSDIAATKVGRNECGPDYVTIMPKDLQ